MMQEKYKTYVLQRNPLMTHIEKKMMYMNTASVNRKKALQIVIELLVAETIYLLYCIYFFSGIWYLNVFIVFSGIIFAYAYIDIRLELIQNRFRKDVPKTIRKLRYYLIHTKDISKALHKTYEKAPISTKKYIKDIQEAIDGIQPQKDIEFLRKKIPFEWLKMICNLSYYCKVNGDKAESTSSNFSRITNIIEFQNLRQGLDNVELVGSQIFVSVLPLIGIPLIQTVNQSFLTAVGQGGLYNAQLDSIQAAKILFISNMFTIFLSWLRKNN